MFRSQSQSLIGCRNKGFFRSVVGKFEYQKQFDINVCKHKSSSLCKWFCLFSPVINQWCAVKPLVMKSFLYIVVFILLFVNVNCHSLSHNVSFSPSSWHYRRFAAWDFRDVLGDSRDTSNLPSTGEKLLAKTRSKANNLSPNGIKEDIMSALERYILKNTSSRSKLIHDEESSEGLHQLHLLAADPHSGAVCLDGSLPGIYLRYGKGKGKSKWFIFFDGGAWCHDRDSCYERSSTDKGSSKSLSPFLRLEGVLSSQARYNPGFYNWNSALVCYCDGGSFTGYRRKPLKVKGKFLYFRGRRILDAVVDDLIRRGIHNASEIILGGRSSGGLSALIHADYIKTRFRRVTEASFLVLSDGGFFLDSPSWNGSRVAQSVFRQVHHLHNSSTSLNRACVRAQRHDDKWRCFFPEYSIPFVESAIYVVNPLYDSWQIAYFHNVPCILEPKTCNATELSRIMEFRKKSLHGLRAVLSSNRTGLFADSCFTHSQTSMKDLWTKIQVDNVTMNEAFAQWYSDDRENRFRIDKPYPSNPTCPDSDARWVRWG